MSDFAMPESIAAKRFCATCCKSEKEVPITTHQARNYRQCDYCHHEQLDQALSEERGYAAMVRRSI